tara:strand:- start:56883 stop:57389 length:507 start_codon:yes stop_codon:yes gene_type:complete
MTVNRVAERISLLLAWLAGIMAVAMMFHISLDVFCKYFFNRPLDGTIEIVSLYYMVGIVFLPISYISLTDSHIVVELFTVRLSDRNIAKVKIFSALFTVAYIAIFAVSTALEAFHRTIQQEIWETAEANVAAWPSRWILPISGALMVIAVLLRMYDGIASIRNGSTRK